MASAIFNSYGRFGGGGLGDGIESSLSESALNAGTAFTLEDGATAFTLEDGATALVFEDA